MTTAVTGRKRWRKIGPLRRLPQMHGHEAIMEISTSRCNVGYKKQKANPMRIAANAPVCTLARMERLGPEMDKLSLDRDRCIPYCIQFADSAPSRKRTQVNAGTSTWENKVI
jgi:hypothetical protein